MDVHRVYRSTPSENRNYIMPKDLVIVESSAKVKPINKYLGTSFVVKACLGHVRDLPSKNPKGVKDPVPGVDVEHDFVPTYQALPKGKKVLTELKKLAKDAGCVYLATDLDREGEAIAWHLAEALKLPPEKIRRVVFNEITRDAVQAAFAQPRDINMDMVNAQQARRILDRIVGYQVSPLLWKKVAGGLSAGRVQTVAVRLIVEREAEIDAFVPTEGWRIDAIFCSDPTQAKAIGADWDAYMQTTPNEPKANFGRHATGPTKPQQQNWLAERGAFRAELVKINGKKYQPAVVGDALPLAESLGLIIAKRDETDNVIDRGIHPNRTLMAQIIGSDTTPAQTNTLHEIKLTGAMGESAPAFTVRDISQRETKSRPGAPFTTAALQQAASTQLRFRPRRTMQVAQKLYEGIDVPGEGMAGLITYMRTDSRNLSRESIGAVRDLIGQQFGGEYLPEKANVYSSGSRAQEAHEAIRPTDARRDPASLRSLLSDEEYKLYNLIWRQFVACQMTPAIWNVTDAQIVADANGTEATFKATGRTLVFDGFLRVMGRPTSGDQILPALTQGQAVGPVKLDPRQSFTQGPARFTEAALVKALESANIGRPSTYAAIIQTIQDRQYVTLDGRAFKPSDTGIMVTHRLIGDFENLFDVKFTAHMEDRLDEIEDAKTDWVSTLHEFYDPFTGELKIALESETHAKATTFPSAFVCDDCGEPMQYRFGKSGWFLSCVAYPDCKAAKPLDETGQPGGMEHTDVACPLCGGVTTLRKGRFGPFLSCQNYPDCKGVVNLDRKGFVKHPSAPPLAIDIPCEKCGHATMNLRRSKRGPWVSCAKYPKCRGRLAWTKLEDEIKQKLELELLNHEKANPQPKLKTLDGQEIGDEHTPKLMTD